MGKRIVKLVEWQTRRLETVHSGRVEYGDGRDDVTALAYFFSPPAAAEAAFARVQCAVRETWLHCGMMKTVLVVNERMPCVDAFAARFPSVCVQVERSLIPGDVSTMSADCNARLHSRFDTPYVLVVQADGFPLRPGLDEFVGKYDFIGAPYVRDSWWRNAVCRLGNYWVQNGGFSLRSKRICEAAAAFWPRYAAALANRPELAEDLYYTQFLPRHEARYRKSFRLATNRESLRFSWDAYVPIPPPAVLPFGFHRETSFGKLEVS